MSDQTFAGIVFALFLAASVACVRYLGQKWRELKERMWQQAQEDQYERLYEKSPAYLVAMGEMDAELERREERGR